MTIDASCFILHGMYFFSLRGCISPLNKAIMVITILQILRTILSSFENAPNTACYFLNLLKMACLFSCVDAFN